LIETAPGCRWQPLSATLETSDPARSSALRRGESAADVQEYLHRRTAAASNERHSGVRWRFARQTRRRVRSDRQSRAVPRHEETAGVRKSVRGALVGEPAIGEGRPGPASGSSQRYRQLQSLVGLWRRGGADQRRGRSFPIKMIRSPANPQAPSPHRGTKPWLFCRPRGQRYIAFQRRARNPDATRVDPHRGRPKIHGSAASSGGHRLSARPYPPDEAPVRSAEGPGYIIDEKSRTRETIGTDVAGTMRDALIGPSCRRSNGTSWKSSDDRGGLWKTETTVFGGAISTNRDNRPAIGRRSGSAIIPTGGGLGRGFGVIETGDGRGGFDRGLRIVDQLATTYGWNLRGESARLNGLLRLVRTQGDTQWVRRRVGLRYTRGVACVGFVGLKSAYGRRFVILPEVRLTDHLAPDDGKVRCQDCLR